jgi:hypothetical protein
MKTPPISISNADSSEKAVFEDRKAAIQYRDAEGRRPMAPLFDG